MDVFILKVSSLIIIFITVTQVTMVTCKFYADNGLQQTVAYNFLSGRQKNQITQEILNVLGIEHTPKPKFHEKESSAPKFLKEMYQSLWDEATGDLKTTPDAPITIEGQLLPKNSIRSFTRADKIVSFTNQIQSSHKHHKDNRLKFDISQVSTEDELIDGELWIYRDIDSSQLPTNWTYLVTIYQVHKVPGERKKVTKVTSKQLTSDNWGWTAFNVTSALDTWSKGQVDNHGFLLKVTSVGLDLDLEATHIGIVGHRGRKDHQAFLVAFFTSSGHRAKRIKRAPEGRKRHEVSFYDDDESWNPYSSPYDRYSSGSRSCQKKTLYVSFRDLGWQDWIIAPDGYAAFFCHGECSFPLSPHMNATNHAIVRTLYSLIHNEIPKPCCAPTKLSPILVLYYDDNANVVLKKYKNMVVSSCGCH